jgi:hypothetical protein
VSPPAASPPPRPPAPLSAVGAVKAARVVLTRPEAIPTASWSRAVAVLGRQAIERGMTDLWSVVAPPMTTVRNKKAAFICLRAYIDPALAGRVHYAWGAFSDACHHHVYDLPPSAAELSGWLDITDEFLAAVAHRLVPA